MQYVLDNWYIIVALLVLVTACACAAVTFFKMPTKKQVAAVREWLLFAVTKAEKELGSGTGQLKLRYVYDLFVSKFKIASVVDFDTFSGWVDYALEDMRNMLCNNEQAAAYIESEAK